MSVIHPCALLAALSLAAAMTGEAAGRDVYLLIGQSNMAGRGTLSPSNRVSSAGITKFTDDMRWIPADEPIHFDKAAGAGLAASFARDMADARAGHEIALVPCAVGGSSIARWQPGADLYQLAVARARSALSAGGELKGIIWHQGETDAREKQESVDAYEGRLCTLVAALRKDLNAEDVPFVAGELADAQSGRRDDRQWDAISAATRSAMASCPLCGCVSARGLRLESDGLHFDTASLRILGRRYAEKMQEIMKGRLKQ